MSNLVPLPAQPAGVDWPTENWPEGDLPQGVDLGPLLDEAFDPDGPLAETFAVVVVHRGRVVVERYGGALEHFDRPPTPVTAETPLLSWSMAKSILQAVVGLLVGDGKLDLDAPAAVPEWSDTADPRHAITLRQLLAMRDGLDFAEDYVDDRISDVMQMLWGDGQADMAHFAADRPLAAPPGTRFNYSSGTSNIISGVVARTVGAGERYARYLHSRLFGPLGMRTADPEFDEAGTWVASSFLRTSARDYTALRPALLRATASGTASACCRRAGSTTPARGSPKIPRTPAPTARTGGAWPATPSAPSAARATKANPSRSVPRSTSSSSAWARRHTSARSSSSRGASPWCRPSPTPRPAPAVAPAERGSQAPFGVAMKTGICRSVFSWYSA